MAKLPAVIPVSDLRQDVAGILKRVRTSAGPIVVTQRGRAAAVILSVSAYEKVEEERAILRALARGEREIKRGRGFTLDEVLAEADALLARADDEK